MPCAFFSKLKAYALPPASSVCNDIEGLVNGQKVRAEIPKNLLIQLNIGKKFGETNKNEVSMSTMKGRWVLNFEVNKTFHFILVQKRAPSNFASRLNSSRVSLKDRKKSIDSFNLEGSCVLSPLLTKK